MKYYIDVTPIGTYWYKDPAMTIRHREDGPAIEYADGDKFWYQDGLVHREDGPALEYANGSKCWFLNGERHREDGPAVEYIGGNKFWYLNDMQYSEEEFNEQINTAVELTVADIEKLVGKKVKIVR